MYPADGYEQCDRALANGVRFLVQRARIVVAWQLGGKSALSLCWLGCFAAWGRSLAPNATTTAI